MSQKLCSQYPSLLLEQVAPGDDLADKADTLCVVLAGCPSVEILSVRFLVFIILEAPQLIHRRDMSVLVGRGSLYYSVDKSLWYVVAGIGHNDSGSLSQFLSLLDTEYSMAGMVQVMIVA